MEPLCELQEAPRTFEPCVSVSAQARQFMTQSVGAVWNTIDLSPEGCKVLRADNSEAGERAWKLVEQDCPITLEEIDKDGVRYQLVTPTTITGPEIVLYMFGGGFVVGSPNDDLSMTSRIAHCLGRQVCVPWYPLAPENPYPSARNKVLAVYRSLVAKGKTVFVVGESAGGNLALGLVLDIANAGDLPLPPAVALFSPWIDLTHKGDSHTTLLGLDPTLSVNHFLTPASEAYAGEEYKTSDPKISPLFAEMPENFPPTIISSATRDLLLSDSIRLAKKLSAKGCEVDLRITEGLWHVFEWYPQCPEAVESLMEIINFLKKFCK